MLRSVTRRHPLLMLATVVACAGDPSSSDDTAADSGPGECGTVSCHDSVRISLVAAADVLTGGLYHVAWSLDGVDQDCSFEILGGPGACDDGDPLCAGTNECGAELNFGTLPQSIALDIVGAPQLFELTVLRDGEVLIETGFAPQYQDVHPNGEDCPPVCRQAAAGIDLP